MNHEINDGPVYWATMGNTNCTDGSGRDYILHISRTEATARRLGRGLYVQGANCPVERLRTIAVNGVIYVPFSDFVVNEPTREDIIRQERIDRKTAAIERARKAGLSEDDIAELSRQS